MNRTLSMGCFIVVVAATTGSAAGYFVEAAAGSDSNTGISAASAFATLQRAVEAAAENSGPDMIHVASGEYIENVVIDDIKRLTLLGGHGTVVIATDAEHDVFEIKGGDVTLANMTVTGGDSGIKTEGSETSLNLRDMDVSGNVDRGLNAKEVGYVRISGGLFADNGGDAIKVGDEDDDTYVHCLSVKGATFSNNGSDALDLEEITAVDIKNTVVDGSADEGLEVDGCVSVTVIGGSFTNNADDGLDIDNSQSVRLVSVLSAGNEGNGLQIELEEGFEMEGAVMTHCDFSGNDENGVQIVEDGGVVQKVKLTHVAATDNMASGLEIVIAGNLKLKKNYL